MRGLRRMGCREDEEVVVVDIIIVLFFLAGRSGTRQAGGFLRFSFCLFYALPRHAWECQRWQNIIVFSCMYGGQ